MGALHSLQEKFQDMSTMAEETASSVESQSNSTPVRPVNKRLLPLDPRSPSEEINRTPIIVDKTPMAGPSSVSTRQILSTPDNTMKDPRSPTTDFTRTPLNPGLSRQDQSSVSTRQILSTPDNTMKDPRSPTTDFTRTPLNPGLSSHDQSSVRARQVSVPGVSVEDPRSPTMDFTRTPLNPCLATERQSSRAQQSVLESPTASAAFGSESGIESAEVTPVKDVLLGQSPESPDSALSIGETHSAGLVPSESESSPSPSASSDADERTPLVVDKGHSHNVKVDEDTPKFPHLRSRPPALNKLSKLAVEATKLSDSQATTTRSPLSSVGNARTVSSALQTKNVALTQSGHKLGGGSSAVRPLVDKENCV